MKIANILGIFAVMVGFAILYKKYQYTQQLADFIDDPYKLMKRYLLAENIDDLTATTRPILWIHVPYEYNARNWESWGSRSSYNLNQPYLYLTVQSIIKKCDKSFTICMIDDDSFAKLLPEWRVNMGTITAPISDNMRSLALVKLVYKYGGLVCPISFLCMRDLRPLYDGSTAGNKMMVCENVSRNINSTHREFAPDMTFFGAQPKCPKVADLCEYMTRISGRDFTAQSVFVGNFSRWCKLAGEKGEITVVPAEIIGRKTVTEHAPILVDHLLGRNYLDVDTKNICGIYIPADEILGRRNFEWFARCSPEQVVDSDTILGNYFMLSVVPQGRQDEPMFLENFRGKKSAAAQSWIGFWRTPLVSLYGAKPNLLGNNMLRDKTWTN